MTPAAVTLLGGLGVVIKLAIGTGSAADAIHTAIWATILCAVVGTAIGAINGARQGLDTMARSSTRRASPTG